MFNASGSWGYPGKINEVQFPWNMIHASWKRCRIDMCSSNRSALDCLRVLRVASASPIKARLAFGLAWCSLIHSSSWCLLSPEGHRDGGTTLDRPNFGKETAGLQRLILSIEYIFKRHKLTYLPFLLRESVRVNSPAIARPDIRRGGHARGIIHREGDKRKREDANRNIDVEKRRGRFQNCTKDDLHICAT